MGFLNEPRLGCSFSNGRNWKDSGGMMWPHVTTLVPVPANCRCKQILDIYDDDNNIYIYFYIEIFVYLFIWSKEVDSSISFKGLIICQGLWVPGMFILVTRSFPRLDQLSKICPKMWMMILATWNGWFVGMMSRTGRETLRNICFQKTHFAQVIYFVWFFLQSWLPCIVLMYSTYWFF